MLDSAIAFGALAHAGQKRKYTGDPYIVHPIEVMTIVRTVNHTDAMLIAAVLHDVLEDTVVGQLEVERRFGKEVLDLVIELTDVPIAGNRRIRKLADAARLAEVSPAAQTIKCADLISNTGTIVRHDPKFAKLYLAEKEHLLSVLSRADPQLHARAVETLNHGLQTLNEHPLRAGP